MYNPVWASRTFHQFFCSFYKKVNILYDLRTFLLLRISFWYYKVIKMKKRLYLVRKLVLVKKIKLFLINSSWYKITNRLRNWSVIVTTSLLSFSLFLNLNCELYITFYIFIVLYIQKKNMKMQPDWNSKYISRVVSRDMDPVNDNKKDLN